MPRPRPRHVIALLGLLAVVGPVTAQSDLDLRNENQRLRTRVGDLQRELDAARDRIAELEAQVEQLRKLLGQTLAAPPTAPTPPAAPERVTVDETVPDASPRAVLDALRVGYEDATADLEVGRADSRERIAYLRAVESWARRARRDLRSAVEWHVRILPTSEQHPGEGLRVRAVDPVTEVSLGDPFTVHVPTSVRRKLALVEKRQEIDRLVLRGVMQPVIIVNPDRPDPGPFDNPPLIGPFAEFGLVVDATSLTPPEQEPGERTAGG